MDLYLISAYSVPIPYVFKHTVRDENRMNSLQRPLQWRGRGRHAEDDPIVQFSLFFGNLNWFSQLGIGSGALIANGLALFLECQFSF